jgi:DNA-binding CsgD family transcriptional regulator/tetratricopeptide (TPR) repeat protein
MVRPDRLDASQVEILGTQLRSKRLSTDAIESLLRRSDGNPFYVEELLESGESDEAIPATLRDIVLGRLAGLPDPVRRLLRIAAVAGRRFEYPLLRAATDAEGDFVDEALREAVARSVLSSASGNWGQGFAFRQSLVREALEAELLPNEWVEANHRLAAALVAGAVRRGTAGEIAARIARHWLAAGEEQRALPALVRAGRSAEASGGYPEAAIHYRTAVEIWDRLELAEPDMPPEAGIERLDLVRRAAEVDALNGDMSEAIRHGRSVLTQAERIGDQRAAMIGKARLARFLWLAERRSEAVEAYEVALASIDTHAEMGTEAAAKDESHRARVLGSYARALVGTGRAAEAVQFAEQALLAAQTTGARIEESQARTSLGLALLATGDHARAVSELGSARRLVSASAPSDDPPRPSRILSLVANYADLAGGLAHGGDGSAGDAAAAGAELSRRLGIKGSAALGLVAQHARQAFKAGEWDEADRLATESLVSLAGPSSAGVTIHAIRARVATGRGLFGDAAEHLEAAFALLAPDPAPHDHEYWAAAAELALWRGRIDEARRAIEIGLSARPEQIDAEAALELLAFGARVHAARQEAAQAQRAAATDAREEAETLRAQAVAIVGRSSSAYGVPLLGQIEAEITRASGRSDPDRWTSTVERWEAAGRPWEAAYARWQLAEALATTRGSRDRLHDILAQAHATGKRLGAVRLVEEIEALARRSRTELGPASTVEGDVPGNGSAGAPRKDTLGLSERELEVLALVAEGRTNRQIATELFITEKTAGHHVSNVLGKLGAASRTEAAAIAHRAGVLAGRDD